MHRGVVAVAAMLLAPFAGAAETLTYRAIEAYGGRLELGTLVVERNGAARVVSVDGIDAAKVAALVPSDLRMRPGRIAVGEQWTDRAARIDPQTGERHEVRLSGRVVERATVTTKAGTFETFVIERVLLLGNAGRYRTETQRTEREWYSVQLGAPVRTEIWEEYRDPTVTRILQNQITRNRERYELVAVGAGGASPRSGT
jgi:hypothetical protein